MNMIFKFEKLQGFANLTQVVEEKVKQTPMYQIKQLSRPEMMLKREQF